MIPTVKLITNMIKKAATTLRSVLPLAAVMLLMTVIFTYPSIRFMNTKIIGDGGDNLEFYSYMFMIRDNLNKGQSPFAHTYLYRYPAGFNLNLGSDGHLFTFTGALLLNYFNGPLAYNSLILLTMTANGMATYVFFHRLTKRKITAFICTIAYAYSYTVLSRAAGYTNVLGIAGFPLVALSILNALSKPFIGWAEIVLFFSSLLLLTLTSLQHLVTTVGTLLILGAIALIFYPKQSMQFVRKLLYSWAQLAVGAQIFLVAFVISYGPYITLALTRGKEFLAIHETFKTYSIPLTAYLFPSPYVYTYLSALFERTMTSFSIDLQNINDIDRVLFYGYTEITLFLLIVLRTRSIQHLYLLICFIILFILSFPLPSTGILAPFYILQNTFPFSSIQESERLFSTQSLVFGIILAIGLPKLRLKTKYLVVLATLLTLERLPYSFYLSEVHKQPFHQIVANTTSRAVLDVPVLGNYLSLTEHNQNYYLASQYYMEATYYKKPIVDGYINWPAEKLGADKYLLSQPIARLVCDKNNKLSESFSNSRNLNNELVSFMRRHQIYILVIHKKLFYLDACSNVRASIGTLISEFSQSDLRISDENFLFTSSLRFNDISFSKIYEDNEAMIFQLQN